MRINPRCFKFSISLEATVTQVTTVRSGMKKFGVTYIAHVSDTAKTPKNLIWSEMLTSEAFFKIKLNAFFGYFDPMKMLFDLKKKVIFRVI